MIDNLHGRRVRAWTFAASLFTFCVPTLADSPRSVAKPALPDAGYRQRALMVGKWFGEESPADGTHREWFDDLHDGGTLEFTQRIRSADTPGVEINREVGLWGIAGDIYFVITQGTIEDGTVKPTDPKDAYYYDAFRIEHLDATTLAYRDVKNGERFTAHKVDEDFEFEE